MGISRNAIGHPLNIYFLILDFITHDVFKFWYHNTCIAFPLSVSVTLSSSLQNASVDKLTRDMKRLKMIPQSWQPSDATAPRIARTPPTPLSPKTPTDVANGYGDDGAGQGVWSPHGRQKQRQPSGGVGVGVGGDVMQTPVIERMVGTERLSKLRESLSNITQTPVRTLRSGEPVRYIPYIHVHCIARNFLPFFAHLLSWVKYLSH